MTRRDRSAIRLTHLPTGLSVTACCDMMPRSTTPHHPQFIIRARAWLAAKVWAHRNAEPARPVRIYTLPPAWAAGIRQGGKTLAIGPGVFDTISYGIGLDRVILESRQP